jgi:hypothetical protein
MTGSLRFSQPTEPLTITKYFLLGGTPEEVSKMYEQATHYKMLYALAACHKNLESIERQVLTQRQQTGMWPDKVYVHTLVESLRGAREYPLAIASVLADTVLLVSGEDYPKKSLVPAYNGIAWEIVKEGKRYRSIGAGSEKVASRILYDIEYSIPPDFTITAKFLAHLLFLREFVKDVDGVQFIYSW